MTKDEALAADVNLSGDEQVYQALIRVVEHLDYIECVNGAPHIAEALRNLIQKGLDS